MPTPPNPASPPTSRTPTRGRPRLLTRDQVLAQLRQEVAAGGSGGPGKDGKGHGGLTATARKYDLSVQQLSDVLAGRSNLSKRVIEKLKYRLWEFYEKVEGEEEKSK